MKRSTPKLAYALLTVSLLVLGGCKQPFWENWTDASAQANTAPDPAIAPPAPKLDMVMIPGQRFGPVTANTNHHDLVIWFGVEAIQDEEMSTPGGTLISVTHVHPGSEKAFTVVWADSSRSRVTSIRNVGTAWKLPEGIGVGSSFATLQEKLGRFWVYGFGWDHGGTIALDSSRLSQYDEWLVLRLRLVDGAAEQLPDDYSAVSGEGLFFSDNPHYQALNPTIGEVIVYLTPPPEP
jgi:hypothetical protein